MCHYSTEVFSGMIEHCDSIEELKKEILPQLQSQRNLWKEKINQILSDTGYSCKQFAQLCRDDGREKRSYGAAQRVACDAYCGGRKQHQLRRSQGMSDGHAKSRAGGALRVFGYGKKQRDAGFVAEGGEDGADEQRGEQAEGHGAHGVDEIGFGMQADVFPFQKCFDSSHDVRSFLLRAAAQERRG